MARQNTIINIEPSVLIWARESLGLSVDYVAKKLKKDESVVKSWEEGEAKPTLAQLENLAYKVYKRPLAIFFLKEPPKESTPGQDFRTLPEDEINQLSPELRLSIRKAKSYQLALKELNEGKNPHDKPLHKAFRLDSNNDPEIIAWQLRQYLGVTIEAQNSWKNSELALAFYRETVESNGIFVFQFSLKDARGFSLNDPEFPIIGLKSSDSVNGKIFTLIHELCHILFNTGGVFRDVVTGELKEDINKIEAFCNKFASEFLVPSRVFVKEEVIQSKQKGKWEEDDLSLLARKYSVSKEVILRRILDLELTTNAFYRKKSKEWRAAYFNYLEKKKQLGSGPTYYTAKVSQLGKNYIAQVLDKYNQGKITSTQVADYLGVKINQIPKIQEKMS